MYLCKIHLLVVLVNSIVVVGVYMFFYSLAGTKLRYCSSRASMQVAIGCSRKKVVYSNNNYAMD